jgi:hypothetical protein
VGGGGGRDPTARLNDSNKLSIAEERLGDAILREFPLPATIHFRSPQTATFDELRAEAEALSKRRLQLLEARIPMREPPLSLLLGGANLALYGADSRDELLSAYQRYAQCYAAHAERGYRTNREISRPMVGLGIAATRAGFLTSASQHMQIAAYHGSSATGPDPKLLTLADEIDALRRARITFDPDDDVVVESREAGLNNHLYREIQGRWIDSGTRLLSKSVAPGVTSGTVCGSRKFQFTGPEPNVTRATAAVHFSPGLQTSRSMWVYVTWPIAANATPVHYIVKHKHGETTMSLAQNGWPVLEGNANLWVPLGSYAFTEGLDQGVEVRVEPDAEPVSHDARGQVFADAVLFAIKPLPHGEVDGAHELALPEVARAQMNDVLPGPAGNNLLTR